MVFRMCKRLLIIIPVLLIQLHLIAQKSGGLHGFYGSMNLGPGIVTENITGQRTETGIRFAMHLNVGYFLSSSVQAGITLNGWLFEPYSYNPFEYKGESISGSMIHFQVYPVSSHRLYFKGAYGMSEYTNLKPNKNNGNGHAFMAAAGYEKETRLWSILWGIQLSFNSGEINYIGMPGVSNLPARYYRTFDVTFFIALD
jgi:hypothetical protein